MSRSLGRADTSWEHEWAGVLAENCARTLIAYYKAAQRRQGEIDESWRDHQWAVETFEARFPNLGWRDLLKPGLLAEIERTHP